MSTTTFNVTVSSIISSRLQYIKFKQQQMFETKNSLEIKDQPFQITDDVSAAHAHELLVEFENYSRANRLLTLMWNRLSIQNTKLVFELLSNHQYLNYSVEDLSIVLTSESRSANFAA